MINLNILLIFIILCSTVGIQYKIVMSGWFRTLGACVPYHQTSLLPSGLLWSPGRLPWRQWHSVWVFAMVNVSLFLCIVVGVVGVGLFTLPDVWQWTPLLYGARTNQTDGSGGNQQERWMIFLLVFHYHLSNNLVLQLPPIDSNTGPCELWDTGFKGEDTRPSLFW